MSEMELTKEPVEKLNPDDESLSLVPQPKLNKKAMKIIFGAFGCLLFIAIVIAFTPSSPKAKKDEKEMSAAARAESPKFLSVNESDFKPDTIDAKKIDPSDIVEQKKALTDSGSTNKKNSSTNSPQYAVYDRAEPQKEKEITAKTVYAGEKRMFQSGSGAPADREEQVRKSSIFFQGASGGSTKNESQSNKKSETAGAYDYLSKQLDAASMTDYEKQNRQRDKEEWLDARESDYGSYLESVYTEPFNLTNEVKAGTIIPITLITGISSDLPGDIVAQIIANVYDTTTGQTLLLPKGSKVIGRYDSSVSYGQDRILLAWDRIIRPDGISINIRGMQGTDLQGRSGMADQVDNHLSEVVAASTMHSVFDLAINTVTAWLSSNEFLSSLTSVLRDTDDTSTEVTKKIVDKIVNQQPTIEIRAGMRGNIIVSKDIILPAYSEQGGI